MTMTHQCENGCGATLVVVGTAKSNAGREYNITAEVLQDGKLKTGKYGKPVNHFFDCPKKPQFDQAALDKKHQEVQAGTYYSKGYSGKPYSAEASKAKSQHDENIQKMADEKNRIALLDIDARRQDAEIRKTAIEVQKEFIESNKEIAKGLLAIAEALKARGGLGQ